MYSFIPEELLKCVQLLRKIRRKEDNYTKHYRLITISVSAVAFNKFPTIFPQSFLSLSFYFLKKIRGIQCIS